MKCKLCGNNKQKFLYRQVTGENYYYCSKCSRFFSLGANDIIDTRDSKTKALECQKYTGDKNDLIPREIYLGTDD